MTTAFLRIVVALSSSNSHALALSKGAAQAAIVGSGSTCAYLVNTGGARPNLSLQALLGRMVGTARSGALLLCIVLLLGSIVDRLLLIS